MNTLGDRLKKLRKQKDLTLAEVGEKMGVTEATVQRWESGNIKTLRYEKVVRLASILGTTPEYLVGWGDIKKNNDRLAAVAVRLKKDEVFQKLVLSIDDLPLEKMIALQSVVDALN